MKVFFASFLSQKKGSGERLGAGLLPPINAFGSSRLGGGSPNALLAPLKREAERYNPDACCAVLVIGGFSFPWCEGAFSSRTVPQGSQVTQKFLPLKIASLAALLVAVASVFFLLLCTPSIVSPR